MDISPVMLTAFFLGFATGALIVVLQRERVIDKVRAEFEEHLNLTLSKEADARQSATANLVSVKARSVSASETEYDDFDDEWMPLPRTTAPEAHTQLPY